jgi:hypothetical protein
MKIIKFFTVTTKQLTQNHILSIRLGNKYRPWKNRQPRLRQPVAEMTAARNGIGIRTLRRRQRHSNSLTAAKMIQEQKPTQIRKSSSFISWSLELSKRISSNYIVRPSCD